MATFEHPGNGHREEVTATSGVLAFLFGFVYFLVKGVWPHALLQIAVLVFGAVLLGPAVLVVAFPLWVGYAFAAPSILRSKYLRSGWKQVD